MTADQGCQTITVTVNGEERSIPVDFTVQQLLGLLGIDGAQVAVELNRTIVRQPLWGSTPVEAGAQLEIVQFVGGG